MGLSSHSSTVGNRSQVEWGLSKFTTVLGAAIHSVWKEDEIVSSLRFLAARPERLWTCLWYSMFGNVLYVLKTPGIGSGARAGVYLSRSLKDPHIHSRFDITFRGRSQRLILSARLSTRTREDKSD